MKEPPHREQLIHILRLAHAGELAAGLAYRGHWRSLRNSRERERIKQIENEEWLHRRKVRGMLAELGARPRRLREIRLWCVGRVIGLACHVLGWFLPMYFAGRLESRNWREYAVAAFHAGRLGLPDMEGELLVMSAVEREHELYFLEVIAGHSWLPFMARIFKWGAAGQSEPAETDPSPHEDRRAGAPAGHV